jgi:hypothetical protein
MQAQKAGTKMQRETARGRFLSEAIDDVAGIAKRDGFAMGNSWYSPSLPFRPNVCLR